MMRDRLGAQQPFLGVRQRYWAVLAVAMLLAALLPAMTLWHASSSALNVTMCVVPAAPHASQTVWLVVIPTDANDRTALDGPWAEVVARWDMVRMSMGTVRQAIPGSRASEGAFAVPLHLSMAGLWWVHATLSTPGRPQWQQTVRFSVLPAAGKVSSGVSRSTTLPLPLVAGKNPCARTTLDDAGARATLARARWKSNQ